MIMYQMVSCLIHRAHNSLHILLIIMDRNILFIIRFNEIRYVNILRAKTAILKAIFLFTCKAKVK